MADASYSELLTARVEVNLSDFEAKMRAADLAVDAFASGFRNKYSRRGSTYSAVGHDMIGAATRGLLEFAEKVMVDSLVEVPKHTGVLEDSADILPPKRIGNRVSVTMGYGYGEARNEDGRTAAQYALPVHELYDATHEPPTKDHFLTDPLFARAGDFPATLAIMMKQSASRALPERYQFGRTDQTVTTVFTTDSGDVDLVEGTVTPWGLRGPGGRFIA